MEKKEYVYVKIQNKKTILRCIISVLLIAAAITIGVFVGNYFIGR